MRLFFFLVGFIANSKLVISLKKDFQEHFLQNVFVFSKITRLQAVAKQIQLYTVNNEGPFGGFR